MKKILYLLLSSIIFLSSASATLAAKGIGQKCTKSTFDIFTECDSGDCETSNIKNDGGGYVDYCDCNLGNDCEIYGSEKDKSKWTCDPADNLSHDLDVCVLNKGQAGEKKFYPLDTDLKPTKAFGDVATNVADVALLNEIKTFKPNDMIKIPNLTFTDVENTVDAEGYLNLPWVGQLIKALYNWGMVVASIIAAIMIIMTATKIIVGGGGATADGYKRIGQIVVGLFIVWGSYAILYNINPALVEFKALRVKYVEPIPEPPDVGDSEPDEGALNSAAASNPVSANFVGQTHDGEEMIGKCHVIPAGSFPSFDINTFGDGYNGRCLLQEFIPDPKNFMKYRKPVKDFFEKTIYVNEKLVPVMEKIKSEIQSIANSSPIVKTWIDNFTTEGSFVPDRPIDLVSECNKPDKEETWVVAKPYKEKKYTHLVSRPLSKILKNLHGQKGQVLMGDMHAMGLAIDVYAGSNWNSKPLYTQVPSQVVDVFYNNGFSWLGATAGRDAMHFQYFGNKCFKTKGAQYPDGLGCCMDKWGITVKDFKNKKPPLENPELFVYPIPIYNDCVGTKPVSYLQCLGPTGTPGSMWIRQPLAGENTTRYVNQ